ncbi:MAG: response regulator receiver sensor signal transduction histidine kinase [Parcubacteria group bacterium Athens1014_10]|nr:MAG: response regulator receiver sensor signal transduction histidine kinase [Parcubacteria group bacterium Athens1014_10]
MPNQEKQTKILIIEDEEILLKMYSLKFSNNNFKVFQANNGTTGLEIAKKEMPAIILLDIIMTQLDGFGVLEELKKDKKTKNIPVILLSNLGQEDDIKKGQKLGAVDYLIKANMTPIQVVNKVNEILGKK